MALPVLVFKNQFGEETIGTVLQGGSTMVGSQLPSTIQFLSGSAAPVDGTTGDNIAGPGSLYFRTNGTLYIQTSLITTPVWSLFEAGDSPLSQALTGFVSGAGTVSASDTILTAFNKLVGNTQNLAVINNLITGYVSGAGAVAATDTILQAINKLNGNAAAISVVANAALPSASFTDAAVTSKVLTGLAAGANTPIVAGDTILVALANLQAQINAL